MVSVRLISMNNIPLASDLIDYGSSIIADNPQEAAKYIKAGLTLEPAASVGYFNLGIALHEQRRIHESISSYEMALSLSPCPHAQIVSNLSKDLLLVGDFKQGLGLYESRLERDKTAQVALMRKKYGREWKGFDEERPLKRLIVTCEQGLGDTIMFCRYLSLLHQRGIETLLFVPQALEGLLRDYADIGKVTTTLSSVVDGDLWCPLLSLPHRVGTEQDNIPRSIPYITPDRADVESWKKRIQADSNKFTIAIHWQGNPRFEKSIYNRGRSIPLSELSQVFEDFDHSEVELLSIQKHYGSDQLLTSSIKSYLVKGQDEFDNSFDFKDTASAIACCDLLVSADSSVVHLAGAMGIPTYVALNWIPEWRWGLQSKTSVWYESMILFRQKSKNQWSGVISDIRKTLRSCK